MKYVYLLRSRSVPDRTYVGATQDLTRRLAEHNRGNCRHTAKYAPWYCIVAMRFQDDAMAEAFEQYLKTGSGRQFSKRHFQ